MKTEHIKRFVCLTVSGRGTVVIKYRFYWEIFLKSGWRMDGAAWFCCIQEYLSLLRENNRPVLIFLLWMDLKKTIHSNNLMSEERLIIYYLPKESVYQ